MRKGVIMLMESITKPNIIENHSQKSRSSPQNNVIQYNIIQYNI